MKNLRCENMFCIYQNDNRCVLDDIDLDIQGSCMDCIYVNIDKKLLDELKEKSKEGLQTFFC